MRTIRPSGEVERVRKASAADVVAEIRSLDTRLKAIAGRLIARTGSPSGFLSTAAYALEESMAGFEKLRDHRPTIHQAR